MLPMLLATIENDADRALFAEIYEQYHERMEQAALRILKDTTCFFNYSSADWNT